MHVCDLMVGYRERFAGARIDGVEPDFIADASELPAGVDGAYQLLANLISLGRNRAR